MFALIGVLGPDVPQLTAHAIDTGATTTLLDVLPSSDADRTWITPFTPTGSNPPACNGVNDEVCRHHLDGNATFTSLGPRGLTTVGPAPSTTWVGEAKAMAFALPILGDAAAKLTLQGVKVSGDVTSTGFKHVTITGAVTADDWTGQVIPALQANLTTLIAKDCTALTTPPACGCADGATGQVLLTTFDADHDCAVTADEIASNFLLQVISPDVDLDGAPGYSVSVGFDAVAARVDLQP